ncbi:hypothetical protein SDRG_09699 [Saprolegnia diclina VS20]|uniref:Uncharacterized protein n=1 Tax=Saprolegnia diclina (strain VS20) TaxID=1156394 RepID=T0RK98_SAPDV|nr:hypothetical protein SDRG_09699 [Saprolegnia diclina VS20]EQC32728.1 hypothetical protein SDRG_09699 [Saprolegnia diclina VS20]|eukprot:XP_008613872.1 hypothetical protein SDRG_09699 [Saprolegnia diclina VS20]
MGLNISIIYPQVPPTPPPKRDVERCDLAWSVGWGTCLGCVLGLIDEKKMYPPPARKLLDEIYDYTSSGLEHHRKVTATTYKWCSELESYLVGFLEACTENDKATMRAFTIERLDKAPATVQAVLCSIESGLKDINLAIGLLSKFRAEIHAAFAVKGTQSSKECTAIEAKMESALACFTATHDTLYRARSAFKRDAQHVAFLESSAGVVKTFIQLESASMPMLASKGKELVQLCESYKKRHSEYAGLLSK